MSLKFNLISSSLPVTLETNGESVEYELREMSAACRDAYLDTVGDRLRLDKDGRPAGVKKFDGMQADLLTRCLFRVSDGKQVAKPTVQEWPASVVNSLYLEAQKLNRMNAEEATPAKND